MWSKLQKLIVFVVVFGLSMFEIASVAYSLVRLLIVYMQGPLQYFDAESFNIAYEAAVSYGISYIVAGVILIVLGCFLWNGQAKLRDRK